MVDNIIDIFDQNAIDFDRVKAGLRNIFEVKAALSRDMCSTDAFPGTD
jgi:hypothetical protein